MLLSIIVPVYNVEQYINRCIKSIVNQTYQNIEIILVDDGSTDSSGDLCDKWAKADNRIVIVHKKNGGLSSARNAGIKIAKGDYLGFVDSDDYIEVDMYHQMIEAVVEHQKDTACCGRMLHIGDKKLKLEFCSDRTETFDAQSAIREVLLLNKIDVSACDKIYKKQLFDKVLYPEGRISEDAAVILEILSNSNGVVHIGHPCYHYVFREDSISKSEYNHKKYDAYINCITMSEFIEKEYPCLQKEIKIYCTMITGALLQAMYVNRDNFVTYKSDYVDYRKMFVKGFWGTLFHKSVCLKIKIKFFFVYAHLYPLFFRRDKIQKRSIR